MGGVALASKVMVMTGKVGVIRIGEGLGMGVPVAVTVGIKVGEGLGIGVPVGVATALQKTIVVA